MTIMRATSFRFIAILSMAAFGAATAAEPTKDGVPPPPPLSSNDDAPPHDSTTEAPQPDVTITTKDNETHEEYRLNGQLYMVKVTPKHGPSYYLQYDQRGHARRSNVQPDIVPPMWVIKRF